MNKRKLNEIFTKNKLDAIISESPQTRRWFSGISTTDGWLVIEKNEAFLFVDKRYIQYAKTNAQNVIIKPIENNGFSKFLKEKKYKTVGIESNYLTSQNLLILKNIMPKTEIVHISGQELRIVKDKEELKLLEKACDISHHALRNVLGYLTEGITELEFAAKLDYSMKRLGADKEGFDSIVAFGASSAEPHHHPSDVELKRGDIVKIDFGAQYKGYTADITRTFIFEDPTNPNATDPKLREILQIVREAAQLGREAVKPGIEASSIDKICRDYIASKGYSKFFLHGTGHGLGIDVHELPNVNANSNIILKPGMVITVEPGIYLENIGGARIEDDIVVTKTGYEVLSRKSIYDIEAPAPTTPENQSQNSNPKTTEKEETKEEK